ncbi:HTH-type transcriptional regulator glxA, putative [Ricinus communis]|uniref:HTH-type transcriptional regulator glxA, putative n=1 Tax=Ricinus communis TaxID=3988 RepID=B9TFH2_RICCO|nr:HTH-type transcriptional regulator glxA, putative [Ricinus communis]
MANHFAPGTYELDVVSMTGGIVPSMTGIGVDTKKFDQQRYDTIIVASMPGIPTPWPELTERLRVALKESRRVASICTGAFLLGAAGAFEGREVTTHWLHTDELMSQLPGAIVVPDRMFVRDGHVWSSAGMTAGTDLVLSMVEADVGPEVTKMICKAMVLSHRRPGGQSQFSVLADIDARQERIQQALAYIRDNLGEALTVELLADQVNWSPRHFSRAFKAETGLSPAKAIEKLRVEAARNLIESGHSSASRIAAQTGFGDEARMRRAFRRELRDVPQNVLKGSRARKAVLAP